MLRVILVDDHTILRGGIRALLSKEADIAVVGEADNGQQLLTLLAEVPADVVVMDSNMPVMDGLATTLALRQQHPLVKVLVFSMHDHEQYVHRMLHAGALGYVLKNADITEIAHGIRTVASGRLFLCTEIGLSLLDRALASAGTEPVAAVPHLSYELSKREQEVVQLLAAGLSNAEIADKLFTSKRTIETHRQNIIEKTQAKNTDDFVPSAATQQFS